MRSQLFILRNSKSILRIVILGALLIIAVPYSFSQSNILKNADFSEWNENLPVGWKLQYWQNKEAVNLLRSTDYHSAPYAVLILAKIPEDTKLVQEVPVEPNSYYKFSVWLKTEDIPAGKIGANLSCLETSERSLDIVNTAGKWNYLQVYCKTGENQTKVSLSLRLGGYGALSQGKVWFDDVEFIKVSSVPLGSSVIKLYHEEKEKTFSFPFGVYFIVSLLYVIVGFFVYKYHFLLNNILFYLILIICIALKVALSAIFPGHLSDISTFYAWAKEIANTGIYNFYSSPSFKDYPPVYFIILYPVGYIINLFNLPLYKPITLILLKTPSLIAEIITFLFLERKFNKNYIAFLYLLNPSVVINSSIYGQVDSLYSLFIILFLFSYNDKKNIEAAAWLGLAIATKPQALLFLPFGFFYFVSHVISFLKKHDDSNIKKFFLSMTSFLVVFGAVHVPFFAKNPYGLLGLYNRILSSYPFVSLNAANFWSLIGYNWKTLSETFIGISFHKWKILSQISLLIISVFLFVLKREEKNYTFQTALFLSLAGFNFLTSMHERYNYLTVVISLILFLMYSRRIYALIFILSTLSSFLNQAQVFYYSLFSQFFIPLDKIFVFSCLLTQVEFLLLLYSLLPPQKIKNRPVKELFFKSENTTKNLSTAIPIQKKHILILCMIIFVYGIISSLNLGSLNTPQTFYTGTEENEFVVIELDEKPANLLYYRGLGTGEFLIGYANEINSSPENWIYFGAIENSNPYSEFGWYPIAMPDNITNHIILMTKSPGLTIHEIGFTNRKNEVITIKTYYFSAKEKKSFNFLFDEQEKITTNISYLTNMYFDEIYHARCAYEFIQGKHPSETTHPHLGKLIISLGIRLFGINPFGWRFPGLFAGILMLPLLFILSYLLFKNPSIALGSTFLFAVDHMHFTQTRIATIDSFTVLFILLMYIPLIVFYQTDYNNKPKMFFSILISGIFFGCGIATKWSCIYSSLGIAIIYLWKILLLIRNKEINYQKLAVFLLWSFFCFIIIPLIIYYISYFPVIKNASISNPIQYVIQEQIGMYRYHSNIKESHPFSSPWWQWPLLIKPVWYYTKKTSFPLEYISSIVAMVNPFIAWGFLFITPYILLKIIKGSAPTTITFTLFLSQYFPWIVSPRSVTFLYHFFPAVPFMILLITDILYEKGNRVVYYIYLLLCFITFFLFYPILSGMNIPLWYAKMLRWLQTWYFY